MKRTGTTFDFGIWRLALGYFAFYVPYSALTKALSSGTLPGMEHRVAGFELLPTTVVATVVTMPVIITLLGWWKYTERAHLLGMSVPVPSAGSFASGLAFAAIIATTTLAYTFEGISIVFALLLMRGGVLILAPLVDSLFHRRVHRYSWVALALSFVALAVALANVGSYRLGVVALINLGMYLTGYFFRLRLITRSGKSEFEHAKYRYFVEEQMVAMPVLLLVPVLWAVLGRGEIAAQLRTGFATFLFSDLAPAALLIGVLYAILGTFGTLIYLNRRENSFSIPVNRSSSLLSGVVATYALVVTLNQPGPRAVQLLSAGIIMAAILLLGARSLTAQGRVDRLVLFLCNGNLARSPIAEVICNSELRARSTIGSSVALRAVSAGLNTKLGTPMKPEARQTLEELGLKPPMHAARGVTQDMVDKAHIIFYFAEEQRQALVERFPSAAGKARRLNPDADIDEPRSGDAPHYAQIARDIQDRVRAMLADPDLLGSAISN